MVRNPTEATHAATWPDYLVGGNSNIFHFHPEPWGNDQI